MRGEGNLTYVKGRKPGEAVDDTSGKILTGGRKAAVTGGGRLPAAKVGPDGKFERGDLHAGVDSASGSGTSIFDPVLCELAYRWFCPPAGLILDPFAGGSVRGVVASKLGRKYTGIDLSTRQIAENRRQAADICTDPIPEWIEGDSAAVEHKACDFVFSCPPYGDLEQYSEDPRDLSAMTWDGFLESYRGIIAGCVAALKPDRFACFVVGDLRDKRGLYRNLPGETVAAFAAAGAALYNSAILVTAVGSLSIRVGRQFAISRKLGTTHQYVQVFIKGDPKKATAAIGEVDFGATDTLEEVLNG